MTEHQDNRENQDEQYSFLQETVKDEQISGRRTVGRLLALIGKGIVFGLAAGIVFGLLAPRIMEHNQKQERPNITIPDDEEKEGEEEEAKKEDPEDGEELVPEALPALSVESIAELNQACYSMAIEAERCVAGVRSVDADSIWPEEVFDSEAGSSGIIAWNSGEEVLIFAPVGNLDLGKAFCVKFVSGEECEATLRQYDGNLGFAVFAVALQGVSENTKSQIMVANLGNSNGTSRGTGVVALGSQFGYQGSYGFGRISATRFKHTVADAAYRVFTTDIPASENGNGVLFNLDGEVIGMINQQIAKDSRNMTIAYAISDLKSYMECLLNGKTAPYIGVYGVNVTENLSQQNGIPSGIFVREVAIDSPAMSAGIQVGDVIIGFNGTDVHNLAAFKSALMGCQTGDEVRITVLRKGSSEYVEGKFSVVIGAKN